jgi:hypothetical protein
MQGEAEGLTDPLNGRRGGAQGGFGPRAPETAQRSRISLFRASSALRVKAWKAA